MFELDERLQSDCVEVGELMLCKILLAKDANYPWVILVPMREEISEIYQLDELDQEQLAWESSYVSKVMANVFDADKMNIAALGNVVSQLHIHHVARSVEDPAWPDPIWGRVPGKAYMKSDLDERVNILREAMTTSTFKAPEVGS